MGLFGRGMGGRVREVSCFARASALSFPSMCLLLGLASLLYKVHFIRYSFTRNAISLFTRIIWIQNSFTCLHVSTSFWVPKSWSKYTTHGWILKANIKPQLLAETWGKRNNFFKQQGPFELFSKVAFDLKNPNIIKCY